MTGVRGSLAAFGATSVLVVMACGARSSLLDEIPGAAPPPVHVDAATPIPDAHVRDVTVHDARVDGRTVDAMRDSAQRKDAEDAHDAAPDAIDARPDASDAGHPDACDYTGKPRGTMDTLAFDGDGGVVDFDLDCDGVVFTTEQGAVLSCPIGGCIETPTVVASQGAFDPRNFQVRIASTSLYVTSATVPPPDAGRYVRVDGGPRYVLTDGGRPLVGPSSALFTLPRDGGASSLALMLDTSFDFDGFSPTPASCEAVTFGTTGEMAYFGQQCQGPIACAPGGGCGFPRFWGPFRVVRAGSEGAVASTSFPEWSPTGREPQEGLPAQPVSGVTYCTSDDAGDLECFDLNGSPDSGVASGQPGFMDVLTDTFVLWHDSPTIYFACAGGPTCAAPTSVHIAGSYEPIGGLHDTLFLLGEMNGGLTLATCDSAALLAGSCTPAVFATGITGLLLAGPTRLVATETNVYVLSAGRVLRIAR